MSALMKKNSLIRRWTALLAALAVMAAMLPLVVPAAPALAATPAEAALSGTVSGYYLGSQQGALDDWEELAAVSAACSTAPLIADGVVLTDFVLPPTQTGTASTTVLTALIKGDMDAASTAAGTLVSGATLVAAGYAYGDALNMIAIEAYNRAASASGGSFTSVSYDKSSAVASLLNYQDAADHGFIGWMTSDPDTTGLALVALSLYKDDSTGYAADATHAIDGALDYLNNTQQDNGGFLGWSGNNANSSALVIWGLAALGEDPDSALCSPSGNSPLDALLTFQVNGGGFGVTDNSAADVYATKDATLALADAVSGHSFLKTLSASPVLYKSITVQVIDNSGSYVEKRVTVASDEQIEDALARAMGIDASTISLSDYNCYIDGSLAAVPTVSSLQDGSTLLVVDKTYSQVAYFQTAPGDTMGVNQATVSFGGSQELVLVQADLANLAASPSILTGIPVDITGDSVSDGATDAAGKITISPIQASTTVAAIKSDSWNTYIQPDVAVLPARLNMQPGPAQTAAVSVRVEGVAGNVVNYHAYTAGNDGSSKLTVYDAVTQALDYAGIDYTANASGYISEIGGITAGSGTGPNKWDGWVYNIIETRYLDGTAYVAGMKSQPIAGGEEIVVYYCNDDYTTVYPLVESALQADGSVTITVKAYQWDNGTFSYVLKPLSGVTVTWGQGSAYAFTTDTGAAGTVNIPAAKAPLGAHSLQISKIDAYGLPSIVRLAPDYRITVTATGAEGPSAANPLVDHVYASVVGPNGTLLASTAYTWYNGITPLALLSMTGLPYINSGGYVSSIAGIREFDYGPNSGWLYKINGAASITAPANVYKLNKDDQLVWYYTRDYTQEPGSSQWNPSGTPGTSTATATIATVNGIATGILGAKELAVLIAGIGKGNNAVTINAPATADNGGIVFSVPNTLLTALCGADGSSLTIESALGSITFDNQALQSIFTAAVSNDVTFNLMPFDPGALSPSNQQLVGGHPVYSLSLTTGSAPIAIFGNGNALISLAYTPATGENPDNLTAFFISDGGVPVEMEGAAYNPEHQAVEFTSRHLSSFAIVYKEKAATSQPDTESNPLFTDVPDDFWARDIIYYLASRGIIKGTTQGTFSPELIITRAEYASILARMSGEALPAGPGPFDDVPADAWYAGNVAWAAEKGIIQGTGAGTFTPLDSITRQDIAVMTRRYVEYKGFTLPSVRPAAVFADQELIAPYAVADVDEMQQAGIISGRPGGLFAPAEYSSRAEAAQILGTVLKMMQPPES